ncbi:hypothetical protein UFOVP1290_259 [uncultured Caudovirales phage]|uniref:Uncharacterized protein n=1 Tax=uncultured Caudovirales phage TaxID=2100421 RepID=A0A6J5RI91_9CAUD|nr:hypothetical protein UFOVP1290_259 [uncultured Caudovirales phage]
MNKNGWSLSKINKYHSGRRWRFRSKPGRRLADILHKQRTDVNEVEMKEEDFIGLDKKRAQDLAERKNLIFRLLSVDGDPYFSMPEDKRDDRVCVEIEKSKVTKVYFQ